MATLTPDHPAYPAYPANTGYPGHPEYAGPVDDGALSLADALGILRRRRWLVLGVFALLMVVVMVVAYSLPAVYRSTATILIKEQEIPQEFVRSTVTSFADERIQVISQQVLTRATLLELVDKYSLYGSARQRETSEEILDRMRRDIRLVPVSAEVTDRRTGSPVKATIAFNLSYDSEVAANAQRIANDLTTLFLNENIKNRQLKAAETTSFLDEELARVVEHIAELEKGVADFKRRNQGRTPDQAQVNLTGSERSQLDLQRIEREIAFLTDRRALLEGQLANTKPLTPVLGANGTLLEADDRLRTLKSQLITLSAQYADNHPDLRRVRREMAVLEADAGSLADAEDREQLLERLRNDLTALRKRYADQHPDVLRLQRTYDSLEAAVRSSKPAQARSTRKPDNPTYINLQTQISTAQSQVEALVAERKAARDRLSEFQQRLAQSGEVEREYLELARDMESSRARFRELRDKQMQAQVAEQLERSRKAERFTIIEPPVLPEKPYRPNRTLIVWLGAALALAGALGAVALAQALDGSVQDSRDLLRVMQVPVLAVLPPSGRLPSRQRHGWLRLLLPGGALLLLGIVAAAVHAWIMPLDVLWFSIARRLGA